MGTLTFNCVRHHRYYVIHTHLLISAAGRQLPGGKDAIEEAIKSWLRHAPERMAGKKENRREVDQADGMLPASL